MNARRRWLASRPVQLVIVVYLVIGSALTWFTQGFFCGPITQQNRVLASPQQEFVFGWKGETVDAICPGSGRPFCDDRVVVLSGSVSYDEQRKPTKVWLAPFAAASDAVCFHLQSETTAQIEYFPQAPADRGVAAQLIFIDECWPTLRLKDALQSLEASGKYPFCICPAKPMEHTTTLTLYGLGANASYEAKVGNPEQLPYLHRSRQRILANRLHYLWAAPLDAVVTPIGLPAFLIWWRCFVRF